MNENEQAIFDIIMKHMRINGSEDCSTSEFESDVEDAAKEIAAQQPRVPDVLRSGHCEHVPDGQYCPYCKEA